MRTSILFIAITLFTIINAYVWNEHGKHNERARIQKNLYEYYGEGDMGLKLNQVIIEGDTTTYSYE